MIDGDGCTLWIDGSWRHCCDLHDFHYDALYDKLWADIELYKCVADTGYPIIAIVMFIGVTLFGSLFYYRRDKVINLSKKSILEIASHEGLCRSSYRDSVGVLTWSMGITNATGHKVERYLANPQTLERCLEVYLWALQKYVNDVDQTFKGYNLTEAQRAAAISFHYNTGAIKRATWVKEWKEGKVQKAKLSIMDWNKPSEIIGRRKKERDLFFDGKWSGDGTVTEYEATAKGQLIFKSAKKTNISEALNKVLSHQYDKDNASSSSKTNIVSIIINLIKSIFGVKK